MADADAYRQQPQISFIGTVMSGRLPVDTAVIAVCINIHITQARIRYIARSMSIADNFFTFDAHTDDLRVRFGLDYAFDVATGFAVADIENQIGIAVLDTAIVTEAPEVKFIFRGAAGAVTAAVTESYAAAVFATVCKVATDDNTVVLSVIADAAHVIDFILVVDILCPDAAVVSSINSSFAETAALFCSRLG